MDVRASASVDGLRLQTKYCTMAGSILSSAADMGACFRRVALPAKAGGPRLGAMALPGCKGHRASPFFLMAKVTPLVYMHAWACAGW